MMKRIILLVIVTLIAACTTQTTTPTSIPPDTLTSAPLPQGKTIIVTSTSDSGTGSLRQALLDAQPYNTITFDPIVFPPDAPVSINVSSELPHIRVNNLTLDASNAGVILDGSHVTGEWVAGLQIVSSEANTIMGLHISHFPGPGIAISGDAKHNVIGGDRGVGAGPFGQGNLISNNVTGIDLATEGTALNIVTGNLIGTDLDGSDWLGNERDGVIIWEGAHNNTIGPGNIITNNGGCGIKAKGADSSGNTLTQNSIYDNDEVGLCLLGGGNTTIATNCPDCTEEPHSDEQASMIFHNGVILTMENEAVASAIAVKDERIMDVGSDEAMLAYAGSGTALIDLEGRTLMPGFVDPHSHIFANWPGDPEGAQNDILAKGITTYGEMSAHESIMHDIVDLERAGRLRLRVSLYPAHVDNCGNIMGSWYLEDYPVTREPGATLQIPGVKIFNDGGSCNVPATSYNYIGRTDFGDLYFSAEELSAMLIEIQSNGYQAAIHSLGDRAIEVSQKAIAAALDDGPNTLRHRIEHNAVLPDELLPVYSEHDIVALIFGYFPTCSFIGDTSHYKYVTPPEYQYLEWRYRPLVDANPDAHIAWHADSPPMGSQDPFLHLHGFVTRKQIREDGTVCEPPEWAADDLFTIEEALPMMTIKAAYALHREEELGSLKAGKLADLIILSDNPLEVIPDDLLNIQVLMTMVGGKVEYCAGRPTVLCP